MVRSDADGASVRRRPPVEEGTIRVATASDVRALHRLICDLERTEFDYDSFCRRFESQLADAGHTCLVFEHEDEVEGMLNLQISSRLHHERPVAEALECVVDDKARGRRIGARLLRRAREIACEAGCELIEVTSNLARTDAHRFYEREGMARTHLHLTMPL